MFAQITVEELGRYLAETSADRVQLVDVRERYELELAALPGFAVFPLSEFAEWSDAIDDRLDRDTETLVLCHHGVRSAQMCQWLSERGFTNVKNIVGGIDAYSMVVDRAVPRY
ncbi:rhodanese-like domain-containing protein [Microcoleus sp. herbarium12]|jgi:rhodanese-related sulfurtransferase|uniref:rhodanese-like domain-containing protein n=1 Tax=Microcoleus sp. herbarium12 TaxID=3055437 RepID=UPI002FCF1B61